MKTVVFYYSNTGNNYFIARQLERDLEADCFEIETKTKLKPWLIFTSYLQWSVSLKPLDVKWKEYQKVVLVGPIWVGSFISPLRAFIKQYSTQISQLHFVSVCGSSEEDKNSRYGYERVFKQVRKLVGSKNLECSALSIGLTLPESERSNSEKVMKVRMEESTFHGDFKAAYHLLLQKIKMN